jgi:hypothetical protein
VQRLQQLLPLFVGHLDELRSDFSVLHRIDRIEDVEAVRLVMLAELLVHYPGAVRAAGHAQHVANAAPAPAQPVPQPAAPRDPAVREVPATAAAVAADPVLSTVISFGRG